MSEGYMALGRGLETAGRPSFDVVFNSHRDYVYGIAQAILRNTHDAEDVTQEVFLRVYKALPTYDAERASMRTWLAKMAVNACQTHRRRNFLRNLLSHNQSGGEELPEPADPSPWGAPEEQALLAELRRAVQDVLGRLRIEHRTVVVLHYYMDMPCSEIARVLDCPEGTVYSRLHYARRLVQAQLERDGHGGLHPGSEVGR